MVSMCVKGEVEGDDEWSVSKEKKREEKKKEL